VAEAKLWAEALGREASLRVKDHNFDIFDAKLRFTLLSFVSPIVFKRD
jgi:hypothetical protein